MKKLLLGLVTLGLLVGCNEEDIKVVEDVISEVDTELVETEVTETVEEDKEVIVEPEVTIPAVVVPEVPKEITLRKGPIPFNRHTVANIDTENSISVRVTEFDAHFELDLGGPVGVVYPDTMDDAFVVLRYTVTNSSNLVLNNNQLPKPTIHNIYNGYELFDFNENSGVTAELWGMYDPYTSTSVINPGQTLEFVYVVDIDLYDEDLYFVTIGEAVIHDLYVDTPQGGY